MATRAEWFRYHAERAGPKKAKPQKKKKPAPKPHNVSLSAKSDRKALYALEDVAPGKSPSRKSTRKASNRQKTDAQFRMRRSSSEVAPQPRTALRRGNRRPVHR